MIVNGTVGNHPTLFFVDSGLVAFNTEQGQAAMLAPRCTLDQWGAPSTNRDRFPEVTGPVALDGLARSQLAVFPVSDRLWLKFGDWAGLGVRALLSWGFMRHFRWTIDFDRYMYSLAEPGPSE